MVCGNTEEATVPLLSKVTLLRVTLTYPESLPLLYTVLVTDGYIGAILACILIFYSANVLAFYQAYILAFGMQSGILFGTNRAFYVLLLWHSMSI